MVLIIETLAKVTSPVLFLKDSQKDNAYAHGDNLRQNACPGADANVDLCQAAHYRTVMALFATI